MTPALVLLMSSATVAGYLLTLARVTGWRRILKHATLVDVSFTAGAFWLLAGTLTGGLVAIVSGLFMAGVLSIARVLTGRADSLRASVASSSEPAEDWCPGGTPGSL
jgi:hypothetical protein